MKMLNWTWGIHPQEVTIDMLKSSAKDRMISVIEFAKTKKDHKETYFCSSGGLKATTWTNRYNQIIHLQLEFVLTDWDSDGDENK